MYSERINTIANLLDQANQHLNKLNNNHSAITVNRGKIFYVSRPENLTTGYSWEAHVTSGLRIISDQHLQPNTKLLGAPGTRVWKIRAMQKGVQQFEAVYKRPWEKQTPDDTVFNEIIDVQ